MAEKYNASNIAIEQILNFIKSGEIAIPEIQRPFVWKPSQVRDLIDIIGDIFYIFQKGYLQKNGITEKSKYNQIAN